MKPLILWLLAIFTLTVALATCGDSDDDDSTNASDADDDTDDDADDDDDDILDDDADDDTQPECNTWTDSTSGLTWTANPVEMIVGWSAAAAHCDDLVCDGYDDWRLPTISELRSLIRGCISTQHGGECGVTDDCLDVECAQSGEDYICTGCAVGNGPSDGCYWPDEMAGSCANLWSSSDAGSDELHWYVAFYQAGLATGSMEFGYVTARCARGEFAPVVGK